MPIFDLPSVCVCLGRGGVCFDAMENKCIYQVHIMNMSKVKVFSFMHFQLYISVGRELLEFINILLAMRLGQRRKKFKGYCKKEKDF